MVDQWEAMVPYILIAFAVAVFLVLVVRFWGKLLPQTLRNRLTAAFLGVAGISVLVVVGFVLFQIDVTLTERVGSEYVNLATAQSERLAEQLAIHIARVQNLNKSSGVVSLSSMQTESLTAMSPDQRTAHIQERKAEWSNPQSVLRGMLLWNYAGLDLHNLLNNFPVYTQLMLTDAYGNLVAYAGEAPSMYYYGDELWWGQVRDMAMDEVYIGNPQILPDGQTATVDIAVPVSFGSDTQPGRQEAETNVSPGVIGILWARLRLNDLSVFVDIKQDISYELALVDNDTGLLLYNSDASRIGTVIPAEVQTYVNEQPFDWDVDPDATGRNIIHGHAKLEPSPGQVYLSPLNWAIIIQSYEPDILTRLADFLQPVLIGGVIALIVAGGMGLWLSWQLTQPIKVLTNIAVAMANGQLGQATPETGPSELQTLARSFNSMTDQLRQMLTGLEQRVAERTRRLEIVAALGERLSAILKLEELLAEVVNRIQESFGYYHAHIYLFDDKRENLVVAAGTGEAGAEMKAKGHSIPLDAPTSLVARAARAGQIVRVDNVRETEEWLPNPLLPDTYSEMAVPIILSAEGQVVGVLDVQEDEMAGLDEGDAALLRSLANQVAVAIRNARLFEEVETALAEAHEVQRRYVEQAWDAKAVAHRSAGRVQFSLGESTTLSEIALAKAREQAFTQTEPTVISVNEHNEDIPDEQLNEGEEPVTVDPADMHHILVAPIALGETVIGNLQLHEVEPDRQWSEGDLALINAVIDQVAQTAENLRLLDVTQERASREQLISQVSDKLRRAPDVETLMKTAVAELSRVLGPAHTFVRLGPTEELSVTQAEEPSSDKNSELEVEAQVEGDSTMDAELEFGVVQRETSGSSEPAELGVQAQVEADSVLPSTAELDLAGEEELSSEELSGTEAPVEIEDDLVTLPEDTSAQSVDNEAEREDEPHIMPD